VPSFRMPTISGKEYWRIRLSALFRSKRSRQSKPY
jgi:hypothetical protein